MKLKTSLIVIFQLLAFGFVLEGKHKLCETSPNDYYNPLSKQCVDDCSLSSLVKCDSTFECAFTIELCSNKKLRLLASCSGDNWVNCPNENKCVSPRGCNNCWGQNIRQSMQCVSSCSGDWYACYKTNECFENTCNSWCGYRCPSNHQCVTSCSQCYGYPIEAQDSNYGICKQQPVSCSGDNWTTCPNENKCVAPRGCNNCRGQNIRQSMECVSSCSGDWYACYKTNECFQNTCNSWCGYRCPSNHQCVTSCSQCSGYPYEAQDSNYGICQSFICSANCQKDSCSTSTNCWACNSGYYRSLDYYSRVTCQKCSSNCKECTNNQDQCTSCNSGYYLESSQCKSCSNRHCYGTCDSSNGRCSSCQTGYYLDSNGNCNQCYDYTKCNSCSSYPTCTSCISGYYINSNGYCTQCPSNCQCTNGRGCYACDYSYFLNSDYCAKCDQNCNSGCSNNVGCTSCTRPYFAYNKFCSKCDDKCYSNDYCKDGSGCEKCISGYYSYKNGYRYCQKCVDNCADCQNDVGCTNCKAGYYLYGGSCKPCPTNCSDCQNNIGCKSCIDGYQLQNSKCDKCVRSDPGCAFCNEYGCVNCKSGFGLLYNGICSIDAKNASLVQSIVNNKQCPSNCIYCDSNNKCTMCEENFIVDIYGNCSSQNNSDLKKANCDENCDECQFKLYCSKCKEGFDLQKEGNCKQRCKQQYCINCTDECCLNCQNPFVVDYQGNCGLSQLVQKSICDDQCSDCKCNIICKQCNDGFTLKYGSCIMNGCKVQVIQDGKRICKRCYSNFNLVDNKCQPI